MSRPLFTNNAASALAQAITPTDTILQLTPGTGSYFPQPTIGDYFMLTLVQINNPEVSEIVECIDRVGDTLTVVRGQEGTQPQIFNLSDNVELRITAGSLNLFAIGGGGGSSASGTSVADYTATQGQTAFTLPWSYTQGIDNLAIFINGSKQVVNVNYTESTTTSFTMASGLNAGDIVQAIYNLPLAGGIIDASNVIYNEGSTGAINSTVKTKLQESVSIEDFGASTTNTDSQNATALLAAEAAGFNYIYVPPGTFNVTGSTVLTKKYVGPGTLNFSGIGTITFTGSGLNDLSLTGSAVQSQPLQIVIRIVAVNQTGITGAPSPCDTYEYSFNGGVTWVATYDAYNPADDQVYSVRFGCNANLAYSSPTTVLQLGGTGVTAVFGANTGHTVGNTWAFTLTPNPQIAETHSGVITKNGTPIAGVTGVGGQNAFLGANVFGNLNNTGNQLTAIGYNVLKDNTVGYANTAGGISSMESNTSGSNNTALGANSLYKNTSGSVNTAIGIYALQANITGIGNVGVGSDSGAYNQDGNGNTSIGTQSLYQNTHGVENAAVGLYALRGGIESLGNGTSQNYCTAMGAYSLYLGGGQFNSALGHQAGYKTAGSYNTFLGALSGYPTTTTINGGYNIFIGYLSGSNSSQVGTVQNCVALGDGTYTTGDNAVAIGSAVVAPANHVVIGNASHTSVRPTADGYTNLGNPSNRWATVYAATGTINTSDANQKTNIVDISDVEKRVAIKLKSAMKRFKFKDGKRYHFGTIAQDVKTAFESEGLVAEEYGVFCSDTLEDGTTQLGVRYDELFAFIISAI